MSIFYSLEEKKESEELGEPSREVDKALHFLTASWELAERI